MPIGTVEEIQGKLLVAKGIGGEVKAFNDVATCFLALQSGQVDAVIMDNTSTAGQMEVTPNMRTIGGVYNLDRRSQMAGSPGQGRPTSTAATAPASARRIPTLLAAVNQALDDMDADGIARGDPEEIRRVGRLPHQGSDHDTNKASPPIAALAAIA